MFHFSRKDFFSIAWKILIKIKLFFRRQYLLSYPAAEETCRSAEPRSHLPSIHSVQEVTSLLLFSLQCTAIIAIIVMITTVVVVHCYHFIIVIFDAVHCYHCNHCHYHCSALLSLSGDVPPGAGQATRLVRGGSGRVSRCHEPPIVILKSFRPSALETVIITKWPNYKIK